MYARVFVENVNFFFCIHQVRVYRHIPTKVYTGHAVTINTPSITLQSHSFTIIKYIYLYFILLSSLFKIIIEDIENAHKRSVFHRLTMHFPYVNGRYFNIMLIKNSEKRQLCKCKFFLIIYNKVALFILKCVHCSLLLLISCHKLVSFSF